jgi:Tfp pilus assembly protein PilW
MECRASSINTAQSGQGLVETILAVGLGSMLLVAVASAYYFSARSFSDLANYLAMDSQSRVAFDVMGKDIRQADRLNSYTTNQLVFQSGSTQIAFNYSPSDRTLTRVAGGVSQNLLRGCDYLRYDIFQRNLTNGAYDYYPTATATNCKVVQMTWICSQNLFGRKADSASLESAKIVIRKQQ